jgi:hypothetical protein
MPVNVGTLTIDLKANTSEFSQSMDKASEQAKKTAGDITRELVKIGEEGIAAASALTATLTAAAGGFTGLTAAVSRYTFVLGTAASSGTDFVNIYRGVRLALSPTPFTVMSLAIGVAVEETVRLTNARAKLIEQQSLLAATSGRSIASVEAISSAARISGGDEGALQMLQGLTSDDLADVARRFAAIEDPVKRAAEAVRIFGAANAGLALKELTPEFAAASDAIDKFGGTLNEVSRTQIFQFRQDLLALKRGFTELPPEVEAFADAVKTRMEEMAAATEDAVKRALKALDDYIARKTGLRGAALPAASLSAEELAPQRPNAAALIAGQDLIAQDQAAQARAASTLEGQRKARAAAQKQLDDAEAADRSKLSAEETLTLGMQMQAARQRLGSIEATIKTMEAAEAAAKKAAAKAQELADWQAKEPERLREALTAFAQRLITTPVAAEMARMSEFVLRDFDKTTPEMRAGRAALVNTQGALAPEVAKQQKAASDAAIKGIEEAEKNRQKLFQEGLTRDIKKGEEVLVPMRAMAAEMDAHAIALAQIAGQPGDEVATAQKILDIKLKRVETDRAAYDDEARTLALDEKRQAALDEYKQTSDRVNADRQRAALDTGGNYAQQLKTLQQEQAALEAITVTAQNANDIALARKALNDQILHTLAQQALAMGSLRDGVRAFFLDIQANAIKSSQIIYEAMNSTIDRLSGNLANLMSGQKADWASMFKDIGHQMEEQAVKGMLQKGLGALGSKLGINLGSMSRKDGQSADTALYVQLAGAPGPAIPGGKLGPLGGIKLPNLPGMNEDWGGGSGDGSDGSDMTAASSGFGKVLGFLGKLIGGFGGGEAGGGEVSPGSAYLVGERGPELYTPGGAGSISSADQTQRLLMGGATPSVHYYNIDARGTDPVLTEQRTKSAIIAAHNSAVMTSQRVIAQRDLRTPQPTR